MKKERKKSKIEKDKATVAFMIELYCRHKEGNSTLCPRCKQIMEYAMDRLEHCRYGVNKVACKNCPTHCYRPEMRQAIREVMRYSGPRMMIYAPWIAIKHFLLNK
jgi:predicted amidophosphoribosyltransferase